MVSIVSLYVCYVTMLSLQGFHCFIICLLRPYRAYICLFLCLLRHYLFRLCLSQSAPEFCPIHCPNGRLGQDLGFGGSAFALKLPELLNRNLVAVRAKLGQTSCFPNGPQIWCPIGQ